MANRGSIGWSADDQCVGTRPFDAVFIDNVRLRLDTRLVDRKLSINLEQKVGQVSTLSAREAKNESCIRPPSNSSCYP